MISSQKPTNELVHQLNSGGTQGESDEQAKSSLFMGLDSLAKNHVNTQKLIATQEHK